MNGKQPGEAMTVEEKLEPERSEHASFDLTCQTCMTVRRMSRHPRHRRATKLQDEDPNGRETHPESVADEV